MARTPHLRTVLSSAEVAEALTQAATLIDTQRSDLEAAEKALAAQKEAYDNLLTDWNKDQDIKRELTARLGDAHEEVARLAEFVPDNERKPSRDGWCNFYTCRCSR